jgi:hypothetical protein
MLVTIGCGALLFAVATACTSETAGRAPGTSAPLPTSATPPLSATPPPPSTTSPATTVKPPLVTLPECTVRDLDVSLGAEEGTAGTVYRALVFTNTGRRTCTIQGFPGVSFVTGDDGHQVGEAARRVDEKGPRVTLKPGETANSAVGFVNIGNFDPVACQPTAVRGLRVYPPHDRKSEFVPFETTGCAGDLPGGQLTVRTVHEGVGLG